MSTLFISGFYAYPSPITQIRTWASFLVIGNELASIKLRWFVALCYYYASESGANVNIAEEKVERISFSPVCSL